VIFVIPGLFGTHLRAGGKRVWLDMAGLVEPGFSALALDKADVKADSLIATIYEPLVTFLSDTHEVVSFAYDWRVSLQNEAKRLADAINEKLDTAERNRQPVGVVAHGTGGLLARVMADRYPNVWSRIKSSGGRVLYLGAPFGGTFEVARMLAGDSRFAQFVELAASADVRAELATFPGVLEALPPSMLKPDPWAALRGVTAPEASNLIAASQTRAILDRMVTDKDLECYVAGFAPLTAAGIDSGVREFVPSLQGDGLAPWRISIPNGMPAFYTETLHGDLAKDRANFAAMLEILRTGATKLLGNQPPDNAQSAVVLGTLPPETADTFPDERMLAAAAVAGSLAEQRGAPITSVKASVVHGNIVFARHPVVVGHYMGDPLVGAEAVLDAKLNGQMTKRYSLGLYPGEIGTASVFIEPLEGTSRMSGSIVVGLGRVGDLKAKTLERTFAHGALEYALKLTERAGAVTSDSVVTGAGLSVLLIGSMGGGVGPEESVAAVLRGVIAANATLAQRAASAVPVRISEVEIVELWEDRAIRAARALQKIAKAPDLQPMLEATTTVQQRDGGLRGVAPEESADWWSRLRITAKADMLGSTASERTGSIRFDVITNRARTEVELVPSERVALDRFVKKAAASAMPDHQTARTLFEMMVPNRLKELAPDLGQTVMVLDKEAAQYPWELLENGFAPDREPISVRGGFIRQLETQQFRETVIQAQEPKALVVGDPLTTKYVRLPGARTEATEVERVLTQQKFEVVSEISTDAVAILNSLYAHPYRILHLAGHGVHEYVLTAAKECVPAEKVSGMLIGDGEFLTPALINQMRRVPELVFINCCHLGRMDNDGRTQSTARDDRHALAANLAVQFIDMGVKAVIAAGWAVDDAAAKTFSASFYQFFLSGETFGRSVIMARQATFEQHPGVNTWGAYQCYGDPGFRLHLERNVESADGQHVAFVTPEQVAVAVDNLAREASSGWKLDTIPARLKMLLEGAPA
ncbi:MAG: CHAT domain-containing protein, partial [Acidobacteriaceae bacterium]|nr:CHAT domain-containing protein [Acidobacteriaceae bacterium]